jgi:flagellar protein FliL
MRPLRFCKYNESLFVMVDEADENLDDIEGEDGDGEEDGKKKKKLSGRTLVLFIVLPLILVGGLGFGALKFFGGDEEQASNEHQEETPVLQDPTQVTFQDLPEMLVNIRTPDNRSTFLSLKVSLEVNNDQDTDILNAAMPRIEDKFQVYLRELRMEDLTGAAGTQRVKEELLRRVNIAASPVQVNAVLIREMIVQ